MKTINLFEFIKDFQYKEYFLEQLNLMLHPFEHMEKLIHYFQNILNDTKTFKIFSEDLQNYIQERKIIIEKDMEIEQPNIITDSKPLNLITINHIELLLKFSR